MIDPGLEYEAHCFTAVTGSSSVVAPVLDGAWNGFVETLGEFAGPGPTGTGWSFVDAGVDTPADGLLRAWVHDVIDVPAGHARHSASGTREWTDSSIPRLSLAHEALRICDPEMVLTEVSVTVPGTRSLRRNPLQSLHLGTILMRGIPVANDLIDVDAVLRIEREITEPERAAVQAAVRDVATSAEPVRLVHQLGQVVVERRPLTDSVEGDSPHILVDQLGPYGLGIGLRVRQWSTFTAGWLTAALEGSARAAGIRDELLITVRGGL